MSKGEDERRRGGRKAGRSLGEGRGGAGSRAWGGGAGRGHGAWLPPATPLSPAGWRAAPGGGHTSAQRGLRRARHESIFDKYLERDLPRNECWPALLKRASSCSAHPGAGPRGPTGLPEHQPACLPPRTRTGHSVSSDVGETPSAGWAAMCPAVSRTPRRLPNPASPLLCPHFHFHFHLHVNLHFSS